MKLRGIHSSLCSREGKGNKILSPLDKKQIQVENNRLQVPSLILNWQHTSATTNPDDLKRISTENN